MALRDALTAKEFDKKFANKIISIGNPPMTASLSAPDQMIPGDRVFFKNIKDYYATRGNQDVSSAYQGEQTVYAGGGQYCGFPFSKTMDQATVRWELLKNYLQGHKAYEQFGGNIPFLGTLMMPWSPDLERLMPITGHSQINRNR